MSSTTTKVCSLLLLVHVFGPVCTMLCPNGQFALNSQCVDCHPSCEECVGHEPYECTECGIDQDGIERFLHRSRCKIHCPRSFYQEQDTYTCQSCLLNCELCTNDNSCQKCKVNYMLQNGACYLMQCIAGQVEDPETGECLDCESGCKICAVDDPESCSSCLEGYFLYRHQCLRHCPQKTYEDNGRKLCFACPSWCLDCKNETHCSSCQTGYYLHDTRCTLKCSNGTFQDSSSWQCEDCHKSCQTCHGPSTRNCDLCPDGRQPAYGICHLVTCFDGQYLNAADGKCYSCDASCQSCFGPQALDCFSCHSGYFLDDENQCVQTCPDRFFADLFSQTCEKCSVTCESCTGSSNNCLTCRGDEHSLFLHEGSCLFYCPEGYFQDVEGLCQACDSSCWSCDENKMKCLSCADGLYLENSKCLPNCSLRYYPDKDGSCKRCLAHCNMCTDDSTCSECSYLYLLFNGTCKATCPGGYYEDLDAGKCIPCHNSCATCSGTSADDCETCPFANPKLYQGWCLENCPTGTFYNSAFKECQECHRTCAKCSGSEATDCIQCQNRLTLDSESGKCGVEGNANCPLKTYLHGDLFTCRSCDHTCESCDGPSPGNCLTCPVPYYLYKNTCVKECPQGTYNTSEEADGIKLGFCSNCHQVCVTCNGGSAKDCNVCAAGYYKLMHLCILHCPPGYYKGNNRCEKCDSHCQLCHGPGVDACLECPSNTLQVEGTTHCVNQCPERFYLQKRKCKKCHPSCRTCNDSSVQGCLFCDRGSNLKGGICYPACEEHRYLDSDGLCQLCDPSCRHCSAPGPQQCISCKTNAAWSPAEMRCVTCCDSQTDQDDCCFCDLNSVLCIRHLQIEAEQVALKKLMPTTKSSQTVSHYSALAPVLVLLLLLAAVAVFSIGQAKSKKKLCWKQSYERLGGSSQAGSLYDGDGMVLKKDSDAEDSVDECDVVYSTRDGTAYRKYSFKLSKTGREQHEQTCTV
ncbi:proprotein convertase subtilisin/kexin type 5-like [Ascaphus truei]|uniref:proprotein convertase subtilisin/kexin type 5-like n=1 Tax=Ascaphus truei TaxID=8439 RepID=UPI003F59369B